VSGEGQDLQGIAGRVVDRAVAERRGDAEDVDAGGGECEQDGDGVIVAGIAVEHDGTR
jgi:hypothetical protein